MITILMIFRANIHVFLSAGDSLYPIQGVDDNFAHMTTYFFYSCWFLINSFISLGCFSHLIPYSAIYLLSVFIGLPPLLELSLNI